MILDLSLPHLSGFELLERFHQEWRNPRCPIIVYTGPELSEDENHQLMPQSAVDAGVSRQILKLVEIPAALTKINSQEIPYASNTRTRL